MSNETYTSDEQTTVRADGYPARVAPRTKVHSMDPSIDWFKTDAAGNGPGVKKPTRGGVVALYGHPHEAFAVSTSPSIVFPTYQSESDADAPRVGFFDRRTGTYYARQGDTLGLLAYALFGNHQAESRLRELNPQAPAVLPVAYPVYLYVED